MITLTVNGKATSARYRAGDAAALGHARRNRADRHQIRLRHRAMRRLHRACRTAKRCAPARAVGDVAGKISHHHRGPVARQQASGAAGLARRGRAAMRLLPVRADHGGGRVPQANIRSRATPTSTPTSPISAAAAPMSRIRARDPPRRGADEEREGGDHGRNIAIPALSRRHFIVTAPRPPAAWPSRSAFPAGRGRQHRARSRGARRLPTPHEVNAWLVIEPDDTHHHPLCRTRRWGRAASPRCR